MSYLFDLYNLIFHEKTEPGFQKYHFAYFQGEVFKATEYNNIFSILAEKPEMFLHWP